MRGRRQHPRLARPRTRGRLGRVLRAMLCALVLLGLLPGSHELLENLGHLLHDGHLAHSPPGCLEAHEVVASAEECTPDAEHYCTPLSHHCGCCASVIGLPALPELLALPTRADPDESRHPCPLTSPRRRSLDPPYRPPIEA